MKLKNQIMIALALGASAFTLAAQPSPDGDIQRESAGPGGPDAPGGHRPPPPVIKTLDINHDGVMDADEIANAPKALLTLDKNGAGQLTVEVLFGPPPGGRAGGPGAPLMGRHPQRDGDQGQPDNGPDGFGRPPGEVGGNAGRPMAGGQQSPPRPVPPLFAALDLNHDGVVDADEIANASKDLLTLDQNGDGQLTADEFMPHRPGGHGPGNRPPGAPEGATPRQ